MATRCVICVVAVVFSKVLVILFSINDQDIVQQTCLSSRMTLVSSSISNSSSLSGAWDRETQKKLKGSKRKSHLSINNTRPSPWGSISCHVLSSIDPLFFSRIAPTELQDTYILFSTSQHIPQDLKKNRSFSSMPVGLITDTSNNCFHDHVLT